MGGVEEERRLGREDAGGVENEEGANTFCKSIPEYTFCRKVVCIKLAHRAKLPSQRPLDVTRGSNIFEMCAKLSVVFWSQDSHIANRPCSWHRKNSLSRARLERHLWKIEITMRYEKVRKVNAENILL